MTRRQFRALIALHAVLLIVLAAVSLAPSAAAQRGAGDRRGAGDYTMVAGRVQGVEEAAIYIVDNANKEMAALFWDRNTNRLNPIGARDLAADADPQAGGGR